MKLLISGATGFIGSRLARHCLALGHAVVALGQANSDWENRRAAELRESGADVRIGTVMNRDFLDSSCAGIDSVIHLAAAQHESNVTYDYFRKVNVEGTRMLLEACREAGVHRFVYGSTIGVYGSAGDEALSEASPVNPQNHYTKTKLLAESAAQDYADRINTTIVRISETYGPEDRRLLKLFKGISKGWFPMVGSCCNKHHPVYVDELADSLLEIAIRRDLAGESLILAGPEPVSTIDMIHSVEEALHCHAKTVRIPVVPLVRTAQICETVLPPFGLTPPLTSRRLDFFLTNFSFDTSKARRLLEHVPGIDFQRGAIFTAQWYLSQGWLNLPPPF